MENNNSSSAAEVKEIKIVESTPEELIERYENLNMLVEITQKELSEKIAALTPEVPQEILDQINDIEQEYASKLDPMLTSRLETEKSAKAAVTELGESVKGLAKHFVFSMRTSWDSKGLEGYAIADPNILKFQKKTPSISIRTVKAKLD